MDKVELQGEVKNFTGEQELRKKFHSIVLGNKFSWELADDLMNAWKEALPELAKEVKLADNQNLPTPYGKVAYESLRAVLIDHKIDVFLLDSVVGETQNTLKDTNWRKVILGKK